MKPILWINLKHKSFLFYPLSTLSPTLFQLFQRYNVNEINDVICNRGTHETPDPVSTDQV